MGGSPDGGRNTGLQGNRPARGLPRPDHHYLIQASVKPPQTKNKVCLSNDVKKDAWRVWCRLEVTRVPTPGCRFCDSDKTVPGNTQRMQARKRDFVRMALIHASYFRLRCATRSAIHAVISDCSQATFLPPRETCAGKALRAIKS
ncbi:hypothetical protein UXETEC1_42860 [Escherichia coli]